VDAIRQSNTADDGASLSGSHTKVPRQPECLGCHQGGSYDNGTLYTMDSVGTELANDTEAHRRFSTTVNPAVAINAGCVGCHTAVEVAGEVSYSYSAGYSGTAAVGLEIGNMTDSKPIPKP